MTFLCHVLPPARSTQGPPLAETKWIISENVSERSPVVCCMCERITSDIVWSSYVKTSYVSDKEHSSQCFLCVSEDFSLLI